MKTLPWILLVALALSSSALSQPSGPPYRRANILRGNRVQTVFGNWGVIGQPATLGSRGAWISPTNGYIGDMSILLGLELPIRDYSGDAIPDTVHSVITCPVDRPTQMTDTDPATGKYWTFEPDSGYFNPLRQTPAIRSDPSSWPLLWPDHPEWGGGRWNGLHGPDSLSGDDETYFRIDDRNDERFNSAGHNTRGIVFHPDSTNLSLTGQGISVGVRYIQSASPAFQDIFYRVYEITNVGKTDYAKVVFGTLNGTYVGVTSTENYLEWSNDASVYFPSEDFVLTWNFPGNAMADPLWQGPVGMFGEAFVETPAGTHMASCDGFAPSNQVSLGNDEDLWLRMKPGTYLRPANVVNDTVVTSGADMDYIYGSDYFPLKGGETKRVVCLLAYGLEKQEIVQKILLGRMLWNAGFNAGAVLNSVSFTNFSTHRFLSGPQPINWAPGVPGGTVSIWYSPDAGAHWSPVLSGVPNTGSATWNTQNYPDAAFGLLRIFASDASGRLYGYGETSSYFTIDNPGNGTPFIRIADSALSTGTPVTGRTITLPLLIGDPEWGPLAVTVLYRTRAGDPFVVCDSFTTPSAPSPQDHEVSVGGLPNSSSFQFEVVVSDGSFTSTDTSAVFDKETTRAFLPANRVLFSGPSHVPVNVSIQDSSRLRADTYVITFSDTAFAGPKTMSVRDSSRHVWALTNAPVYPGIETGQFDGLVLDGQDFTTSPDLVHTRWNRQVPGYTKSLTVAVTSIHASPVEYDGYREPSDYRVVFENGIVDTTAPFAPFEIFGVVPAQANFRVYDMRTNRKVKVALWKDVGFDQLFFLEDVCGAERATWSVIVTFNPPDSSAHAGDTAYIFTNKGLSIQDTLTVSGITAAISGRGVTPASYVLYQNYPNPFNPSTRIDYRLSGPSHVTLRIYNLLGQEVAQIVNEIQPGGMHSAFWRGQTSLGQSVASGVYFCRIDAQENLRGGSTFTHTMKMVYLR